MQIEQLKFYNMGLYKWLPCEPDECLVLNDIFVTEMDEKLVIHLTNSQLKSFKKDLKAPSHYFYLFTNIKNSFTSL